MPRARPARKPQPRDIVSDRLDAIGLNMPVHAREALIPVTTKTDNGYDQRGGEVANGRTLRRLDPLGMLKRQGLLCQRQHAAGEHWATTYQVAGLNAGRAQNYGATGSGTSHSVLPDGLHAVRARAHLDTIRSYLARDDERLLIAVCVMGQSIGKRDSWADRRDHATVLGSLRMALDRVAAAARL